MTGDDELGEFRNSTADSWANTFARVCDTALLCGTWLGKHTAGHTATDVLTMTRLVLDETHRTSMKAR